MRKVFVVLFVLIPALSFFTGPSHAGSSEPYPPHRVLTLAAIKAYQTFISPSQDKPCPMYPSCSAFAYEAFSARNPAEAFMLSADRLHRCGHDVKYYHTVLKEEGLRFYDPVDLSDARRPGRESFPALIGGPHAGGPRHTAVSEWESPFELDDEERMLGFAKKLESAGDYDRAITEYRRFIYFFPGSRLREKALLAVLDCYYKGARFLAAADWGKQLLKEEDIGKETKNEILFLISASYFRLQNYGLSRDYAGMIPAAAGEPYEKGKLLKGMSFSAEYRWEEAEKAFGDMPGDSGYISGADRAAEMARAGGELRLKSPAAAGFLALAPGMGYLYTGHRQTALSSFIVTGLFSAATVRAFEDGNDGLGAILGLFTLGWYSGNIYGSVISAQRYNERARENLAGDIMLAVSIVF